jgi:arylsulfatase A-like enzyme
MQANRLVAALLFLLVSSIPLSGQRPPSLVVLISVDQLRGDYIDRFSANVVGGLARFRDHGAFYPNGRQDHALTATAPGHATMLSGRVPARTNILTNDHGVPDPERTLVAGAKGPGASPWRFHGSTLYDWMLAADPDTRALSVSRKDRGAILPIGRARTHVYWWADGRFTTSTWYRDTLPSWVTSWNRTVRPEEWSGREWTLLLPASAYPEPDDQPFEGVGAGRGHVFPHRMDSLSQIPEFPWADSLTLDLALHGLRTLQLGQRPGTDLLVVSLSSMDAIGHDFGPDSREVHDQVLRVDRWLAWFMHELEREVASDRVLYVLTADHGITSMPAFLQAQGIRDAGRIDLVAAIRPVLTPIREHSGESFGVELQSGVILADTTALRARGVDVADLSDRLATRMAALPGVARTFTPLSLASAPATDESARLWRRSIPSSHAWLALAEPREGWVLTGTGKAEHGTPLLQNRSVPIAFLGAGVPAGRRDHAVRTIDIGPTLAALIGVVPTEELDGVVVQDVLGPRAQ